MGGASDNFHFHQIKCERVFNDWFMLRTFKTKPYYLDQFQFFCTVSENNTLCIPSMKPRTWNSILVEGETNKMNLLQVVTSAMDIPLIPISFLWVKWFGYYSHSKSAFFQKVENAENWPTLLSGETQLFGNFFQMAATPREIWILTWNQSQMKLKTPNFHGKKEAWRFFKPLMRHLSLKSGLILYVRKPRWISMSV